MAKVALVIADVDGTLLTRDKALTVRARAAVHALQEAGIGFSLASGRPPRGMAMLVAPLQLDGLIAGFNGGAYVRPDLSIIEERRLDAQVAARALAHMLDRGLDAWVYGGDEWLLRDPQAPHVAREQWTVRFPPVVTQDLTKALDRTDKLVGVSNDHALVARVEGELREMLGHGASATRSQPYYLDVTHPEANKGAVVRTLSRLLKVTTDRIATIGDGANDALMFRECGISIAMGNAGAEVRAQAGHVTDDCDDEGFAKAIERYVLEGK